MFHMHFTMLFSVSKLNVRLFPKRCVCARVFFLVRLAREFRARQLSALCSPLFGSLNNLFNVYMKDAGQKSVANACGQERGRAGSKKKKELYFAQNNGRLDAFWASANSSGRHGWDVEKEYGFCICASAFPSCAGIRMVIISTECSSSDEWSTHFKLQLRQRSGRICQR